MVHPSPGRDAATGDYRKPAPGASVAGGGDISPPTQKHRPTTEPRAKPPAITAAATAWNPKTVAAGAPYTAAEPPPYQLEWNRVNPCLMATNKWPPSGTAAPAAAPTSGGKENSHALNSHGNLVVSAPVNAQQAALSVQPPPSWMPTSLLPAGTIGPLANGGPKSSSHAGLAAGVGGVDPAAGGKLVQQLVPHDNDVLIAPAGRGDLYRSHPGNERYSMLMKENALSYANSLKKERSQILMEIFDKMRAQTPPGRFLKKDGATGRWKHVSSEAALAKVKAALALQAKKTASQVMASCSAGQMKPAPCPSLPVAWPFAAPHPGSSLTPLQPSMHGQIASSFAPSPRDRDSSPADKKPAAFAHGGGSLPSHLASEDWCPDLVESRSRGAARGFRDGTGSAAGPSSSPPPGTIHMATSISSVREWPRDGIGPDWEKDAVLNRLDTHLPGYAKLREAVRSVRIEDYSHPLWPSKLVERTVSAFRDTSPGGRLLFDDGTLRLATLLELYNYVVALERELAGVSSGASRPAAQREVAVCGTRSDGAAGPRPAASADSSGRTVQEPDRTASRDPPRPVGSARSLAVVSSAEHAARAAADPPGVCGGERAGRPASHVDEAAQVDRAVPPQAARPPLVGGRPSVGPGKGSGEGSSRAPDKAQARSRRPDPPSSSEEAPQERSTSAV